MMRRPTITEAGLLTAKAGLQPVLSSAWTGAGLLHDHRIAKRENAVRPMRDAQGGGAVPKKPHNRAQCGTERCKSVDPYGLRARNCSINKLRVYCEHEPFIS